MERQSRDDTLPAGGVPHLDGGRAPAVTVPVSTVLIDTALIDTAPGKLCLPTIWSSIRACAYSALTCGRFSAGSISQPMEKAVSYVRWIARRRAYAAFKCAGMASMARPCASR